MIAHACVMETREPGEGFALINDWSARSWSLVDLTYRQWHSVSAA